MKNQPVMVDSIYVGDKVVDVCGSIGIYCRAMSTGQVPMIEERYPFSRQMECTLCIQGEKRKLLYYTAKKMGINHIVLQDDGGGEHNPANMADELTELGYDIDVIDFSGSIGDAIRRAGAIYDREKVAEKRAARYEEEMEEVKSLMPSDLGKEVLVLMGLSHPNFPKSFLMAENSGGDADELVIKPSGCTSVGDVLSNGGTSGLGFTVIDDLERLVEVNPDLIAFVCDSYVPQQALREHLASHPESASIPAIANHAIVTLPDCSAGAPVNIPSVMHRWIEALAM